MRRDLLTWTTEPGDGGHRGPGGVDAGPAVEHPRGLEAPRRRAEVRRGEITLQRVCAASGMCFHEIQ